MKDTVVEIKDLYVGYKTFKGYTKVLNGVNLSVNKGERISIVGETGCGKTTTVKSILQILAKQAKIEKGEILFQGKNLLKMTKNEMKPIREAGISMIFQDPMAALNPVFTIGQQLSVVIKYSRLERTNRQKAQKELAIKALKETSLPDPKRLLNNYPFQLSGGMRQRVCIAMALATPRSLVIADEPTTNLDVTIQEQVLQILKERVQDKGSSLILITHSLGVARETTDRIYVMYAGNMVEVASASELFKNQYHPYTKGLISCIPKLSGGGMAEGISGKIPNYLNPPNGCRYSTRCSKVMERCTKEKPEFKNVGNGHQVACFLY